MSQLLSAEELLGLLAGWERRRGPRYVALADAIQEAVHREELEDGTRLPPERALAALARLGRGTVVAAYAELSERGVVERRQGSGTRLTTGIAPSGARTLRASMFGRAVQDDDGLIDLSFGAPWFDEHTPALMGSAAQAIEFGAPPRGYAPLGLPGLRSAVAERLTARQTPTTDRQIVITTGSQGAIQLLTTALVRRGDRVVVEAPTYPGAMELFSRAGAVVVAVRRDHAGPRPDDLARALGGPGAALVFLVATCSYPTGAIMSEHRRREILACCAEHDVLVVDDQTPADLVFEGEAPPSLVSMAPDRVVALGSFSKVLWGGLRTGWLRADPGLILRLGRLKAAQDLGSGMLDQAAVVRALPGYDETAAARRVQARERYEVLAAALRAEIPEWDFEEPRGGWSLWVRLPHPCADEMCAAAARRGVAIATGSNTAPDDLFLDHIRLCFPAEPHQLEEAVRRLRLAWEDVQRAGDLEAAVPARAGLTAP
jgi:DNA-binding transcriptional MocR family regulator